MKSVEELLKDKDFIKYFEEQKAKEKSYLNLWLNGNLKLGKNKEKLVIEWLNKQ